MYIDCKSTNFRYVERRPNVKAYIKDILEYNVLSVERQLELLEQTKSSDEKVRQSAIDELVETNQRFVFSVAKKYANSENLLDLVNEGNIGLITAIKRFNPNNGNRFLTYAIWWIRRYISNYLLTDKSFVKCNNLNKFSRIIPKIKIELLNKYGREPSFDEVNDVMQKRYGCKMIDSVDFNGTRKYEIDDHYEELEDDHVRTELQFNRRTATDNVTEDIDKNYIKEFANFLISKLTETEKEVVTKRFGIGCQEMTVASIANDLNVTGATVRNILKKASNKLKAYENLNQPDGGTY